jgi:hypothetical protein
VQHRTITDRGDPEIVRTVRAEPGCSTSVGARVTAPGRIVTFVVRQPSASRPACVAQTAPRPGRTEWIL